MAKRSNPQRRSRPATQRHYKRTARLNPLIQQIVAEYFEDVDDDRLGLLTVTGVEVDSDLNTAHIYVSNLDDGMADIADFDEERDTDVLDALEEHRRSVRSVIGQSARLRKTPDVVFGFDPAVRAGARMDRLLSEIGQNTRSDEDESTTFSGEEE